MARDPRGARKVGTRRDQPQCDRLSLPLRSSHALLTTCVSERQPASWSYHTLVAKVLNLNTTPRHLTVPSPGQGLANSTVVAARRLVQEKTLL